MERQGISCLAHAAAALAAAALLLAALPQAAGRPGVVAAPQPARRALRATTSGVTVYNQCDTAAPFNAGIYGAGFYAPRDGCDSGYDDPGGRLCLLWDRTVPAGGSAFLGFASSADTFWLTTLEHPSFPSQYISTSDRAFSGMFCSETSDPDACEAYTWFEVPTDRDVYLVCDGSQNVIDSAAGSGSGSSGSTVEELPTFTGTVPTPQFTYTQPSSSTFPYAALVAIPIVACLGVFLRLVILRKRRASDAEVVAPAAAAPQVVTAPSPGSPPPPGAGASGGLKPDDSKASSQPSAKPSKEDEAAWGAPSPPSTHWFYGAPPTCPSAAPVPIEDSQAGSSVNAALTASPPPQTTLGAALHWASTFAVPLGAAAPARPGAAPNTAGTPGASQPLV